jgi:hypothetical protein
VQEEIGAQRRALEFLEAQEQAIRDGDAERIASCGSSVEAELRKVGDRGRRREALLEEFGLLWAVAPRSLTLTSICERAAQGSERLARQTADLRKVVASVTRSSRRLATAARMHRGLLLEVIETVLAGEDELCVGSGGTLVDAEA